MNNNKDINKFFLDQFTILAYISSLELYQPGGNWDKKSYLSHGGLKESQSGSGCSGRSDLDRDPGFFSVYDRILILNPGFRTP